MDRLRSLTGDGSVDSVVGRMSTKDRNDKFSSDNNVFKLEGYFKWLKGQAGKTELKDAADECWKLKRKLGKMIGNLRDTEQQEWYVKDQKCGKEAGDHLGDPRGEKPTFLRNCYHSKFEKR